MADACPISGHNVNKSVVRISAFLTLMIVLIFLFTSAKWIIFILTADFFLRGFMEGKHSPVRTVSIVINTLLRVKPNMVNAGPTIFAAKIGFICSLLMFIFSVLGFVLLGYFVGGILVICAALEACLGYCVGCKIYSLIPRK